MEKKVIVNWDRAGRYVWGGARDMLSIARRSPKAPSTPEGTRIYAFGDVHGRFDLLDEMLDRLDADYYHNRCKNPVVVFLGDYIDRGPQSALVVDRLIEIQVTHQAICLLGNHEALWAQFLGDPSSIEAWTDLGAISTLMSYGLEPPLQPRSPDGPAIAAQLATAMTGSHHKFLNGLKPFFVCGDYMFVHAGIRPKIPLTRQATEDLIWIRDDFLSYDDPHEKFVIHGHTPVREPDIQRNRINIDTGAFATGRLTCLVLERTERRFL